MTYEIATNDITMIPLNKLIASGLNARKITTSAESNAELRASLLAFGVLENLIVFGAGKDKFALAAGERRRASLKLLLKEKKIPANFAVPCIVRPEDEAVELSLAENIIRVAMHPIDQFAAFAALIDEGKTVEDVAARFGITPGIVTRRMKLARVSPVIIEAFREDRITLDAVMGFSVSDDHAEQDRVYADIANRGGQFTRNYVVRMLTHQKVATDDARFLYIGKATYLAAGGTISRVLFDEDGGGYADDSALLDRLTLESLTAEIPAYLDAGWKWVEPVLLLSFERKRGFAVINRTKHELTAEDEARRAALNVMIDEIGEQTNSNVPEDGPLADTYQRIMAELDDIEAREYVYDPAEMALAGGWLTVDRDGHPATELGYVKRDDLQALDDMRRAAMPPPQLPEPPQAEAGEGNPEHESLGGGHRGTDEIYGEDHGDGDGSANNDSDAGNAISGNGEIPPDDESHVPEPTAAETAALSDALLVDLHAARTVALRLELMTNPEIALRAVAHSLAGHLILNESGVLTVTARETYKSAISAAHCPADDALRACITYWRTRLSGDSGQLWNAIMELTPAELLDLIAVCAALSVDATHTKAGDYSNRQRMVHADQLAETLRLDMSKHWTPTAESYFGRVSKKAICLAVAEAAGESVAFRIQDLKKPGLAAEAARLVAGSGWVPAALRTTGLPTGHHEREGDGGRITRPYCPSLAHGPPARVALLLSIRQLCPPGQPAGF
jgi:ParB family chromosome partitioning protein